MTSVGDVPKRGQLGDRHAQLWLYICVLTGRCLLPEAGPWCPRGSDGVHVILSVGMSDQARTNGAQAHPALVINMREYMSILLPEAGPLCGHGSAGIHAILLVGVCDQARTAGGQAHSSA